MTLHWKTGIKVIARSQHASTLKQKNSALARLKRVQEHTSLVSSFVSLNTRRTKQRAHTDNVVKQRSVFNFKNKRYSARTRFSVRNSTARLKRALFYVKIYFSSVLKKFSERREHCRTFRLHFDRSNITYGYLKLGRYFNDCSLLLGCSFD